MEVEIIGLLDSNCLTLEDIYSMYRIDEVLQRKHHCVGIVTCTVAMDNRRTF